MSRDSWSIEVVTKRDDEIGEVTTGHMTNARTGEIWIIGPILRSELDETRERIMRAAAENDAG